MDKNPKRKANRIENYDYSAGAYFVTICTANRRKLFWNTDGGFSLYDGRGELCSPAYIPLSQAGIVVENEIKKLSRVYSAVSVDKYCIMPEHIHLLLSLNADETGRTQFAPTLSRIIKQFKGSITKQLGRAIWQKSFYDHAVRNGQDYEEIWRYIDENPLKYAAKKRGLT